MNNEIGLVKEMYLCHNTEMMSKSHSGISFSAKRKKDGREANFCLLYKFNTHNTFQEKCIPFF